MSLRRRGLSLAARSVGLAALTGGGYMLYQLNRPHDEIHPLPSLAVAVLRTLPSRLLSRLWGTVNEVTLPEFLRPTVLGLYSRTFGCNLEEAERSDLRSYAHLQDFFGRSLKPGVRPLAPASLVCPCDSRVLSCGVVTEKTVPLVKGMAYSMQGFLGTDELPAPRPGHSLYYCIMYLAPGDYHRFHSPTTWRAEVVRHIPGELLSVAPAFVRMVKGLFSFNERVVLEGTWAHGFFTYTAIGAYNVGSIHMRCCPDVITNQTFARQPSSRSLGPVDITKGEEVGAFKLGSSIALVFEAPNEYSFCVEPGQKVQVGQALLSRSRTRIRT